VQVEVGVPRKVAVLVAAHNAEKTIRDAVESVLCGSMPCRVFVVDDGSRVPVASMLGTYGGRVEIIRLDDNRGPAAARNVGLTRILAQDFDYIAIQDADDISYADRLATQAACLGTDASLGAVGSWTKHFDEHSGAATLYRKRPTDAAAIRNMMFFNIGLSHASTMFRADALRAVGVYDEAYPAAEDYELLRRVATRYELGNVPEFLLAYRVSSQGQSLRRRRRQLFDRLRVQLKYFAPLQWRAFAGVAQTAASFVVPAGLVGTLKRKWLRRRSHGLVLRPLTIHSGK
jgi:glycosyltransferase involved in cell wall biosynthesis